jgi:hypothetical protein
MTEDVNPQEDVSLPDDEPGGDSEPNPQDVQTPGVGVADEPGEIGWHANEDSPDVDVSVPEPGSGGAHAVVPGDEEPVTDEPDTEAEEESASEPVEETPAE